MNSELINRINCMDWKDGIMLVESKTIDLVLTDPPYGMSYQSNNRAVKHEKIADDDNLDWLDDWVYQLARVCKPEAHLYIFCSWHKIEVFKQTVGKFFNVKNILIWEKNGMGMGDLEGDYAPKYEMVLFCSNGNKKLNGYREPNILKTKRTNNDNHPTEKPVNLFRYLIDKSSKEGDLVLDTFAGVFPTAQACRQIGRNFICFEINEKYCNKAKTLVEGISKDLFA